jgi:hypothetical protein
MQWFRMYAEFATDPVVQSMSFDDQRHFVVVLCLKSSGALDREFGDVNVRNTMLRRALGLEALAFDEARNRLCASGLIDGNWQPKNWEKRQFLTDHSAAERMRNYRKRHRDVTVTSLVTKSDVLDTESDTESDTEKKKPKSKTRASARSATEACEFPDNFVLDEPMRQQALARAPDCDVDQAFASFKANHLSRASRFKNWRQAWVSWLGNFSQYGYPKRQNGSANLLASKYPGYQF